MTWGVLSEALDGLKFAMIKHRWKRERRFATQVEGIHIGRGCVGVGCNADDGVVDRSREVAGDDET